MYRVALDADDYLTNICTERPDLKNISQVIIEQIKPFYGSTIDNKWKKFQFVDPEIKFMVGACLLCRYI